MKYLVLLGLVLAGCAPRTNISMLTSETAIISGKGSWRHDQGQVTKAILQEAARQTQQRGYDYFQILQATDRTSNGLAVTQSPTTYLNTGGGTFMAIPGYASAAPITIPAGDIMVRFYKTPPDAPNVWEAKAILAEK